MSNETRTKGAATGKKSGAFTEEERAAMKERARELREEERRSTRAAKAEKEREDGEADVLARIAEMPDADRLMATRIHAIVKEAAPDLTPKTWYGMPAYALDGKIVCFYQSAQKFGTRYATLGFNEAAHLDDGAMWPVAYALTALSPADEKRISALVKQAVS